MIMSKYYRVDVDSFIQNKGPHWDLVCLVWYFASFGTLPRLVLLVETVFFVEPGWTSFLSKIIVLNVI